MDLSFSLTSTRRSPRQPARRSGPLPHRVLFSPVSQVCREFQRGNCARGETDCRFAHPADSTMIDTNDNTVTVCMDYIKGRCMREKCKYFHPPAHLQAKIKAAQHQANQAAVAAQAAAAAATVMVSGARAPRTFPAASPEPQPRAAGTGRAAAPAAPLPPLRPGLPVLLCSVPPSFPSPAQ